MTIDKNAVFIFCNFPTEWSTISTNSSFFEKVKICMYIFFLFFFAHASFYLFLILCITSHYLYVMLALSHCVMLACILIFLANAIHSIYAWLYVNTSFGAKKKEYFHIYWYIRIDLYQSTYQNRHKKRKKRDIKRNKTGYIRNDTLNDFKFGSKS